MPRALHLSTPSYIEPAKRGVIAEGAAFGLDEATLFDEDHIRFTGRRMQEIVEMPFDTQRERRIAQRAIFPYIEQTPRKGAAS